MPVLWVWYLLDLVGVVERSETEDAVLAGEEAVDVLEFLLDRHYNSLSTYILA